MARSTTYLYDPLDPHTPTKVKADILEFNFKCPDISKLIVYTIYTYDPHADLLKLFPSDLNRRKYEAAMKAGFKINNKGVFDKWVEDCLVGENEAYNFAIVAFVTRFNIADLPAFAMYREVFFSEFRVAMKATDSKAKKEAMANAEIARKQINDLERKLFTDEETLSLRNALYVVSEKLRLNLRPEHKAQEIEEGRLNVSDPYYNNHEQN